LTLPQGWRLDGFLQPPELPALADVEAGVSDALASPIGTSPLHELASAGMRVALVIDDGSRPTPVARVMPALLRALEQAGVAREDVTLVTALGLHRPMDEEEVAHRVGTAAFAGLRWENHDCDDEARLVSLGATGRGTPVLVNRTVAQADLVISVGCIEPHIIASFGGGYKNIFPGVAGRPTVAHNHTLNCSPRTFNMVGQPIERNPMRLDLEEAGGMLAPPVFILNVVLNSDKDVVRLVAGHPVAAHRAGVETSAELYGVPVPRPADIVITDSHPMDQDLRQGVKALANTILAVRRGGVQITLVRAEEGVGVFGLADRGLPLGRGALRLLAPLLLRLVPRISLSGVSEEDRFFLYFALQAMRHARLLMVAPTIPPEVRQNLPFVEFADTVDDALARARRQFPGAASVLAFPYGGITYPVLEAGQGCT
jgi:nickel-dependent lactate racemase